MDKNVRLRLKREVQIFMEKNPSAMTREVKKFILNCENLPDIGNITPRGLNKFISQNIAKFKETGDCEKHRGGNGRKVTATNKKVTLKVKKKLLKKGGSSIRKVAKAVGVSYGSVHNILHKNLNLKPYHKYCVQKMRKEHKTKRVEFAQYCLDTYGTEVSHYSTWSRLINSDFSAYIRITGSHNSKNDVIWCESRKDGGDLLEFSEEKFAQGEMIFGAVTVRGLVPQNGPIFVSDLLKSYDPKPKSVTGQIYADMIDRKMAPAVQQIYPRNNAVWQDDGAKIHRSKVALEAIDRNFRYRIPYDLQAPKMADVWPIENVWAIIKQELDGQEFQDITSLRAGIRAAWRRTSQNQKLCTQLISSIPKRLEAVIKKKGNQITKEDYI